MTSFRPEGQQSVQAHDTTQPMELRFFAAIEKYEHVHTSIEAIVRAALIEIGVYQEPPPPPGIRGAEYDEGPEPKDTNGCGPEVFYEAVADLAAQKPQEPERAPGGLNVGHGHVTPRPDGKRMRCGGPSICAQCAKEAAQKKASYQDRPERSCWNCSHDFKCDFTVQECIGKRFAKWQPKESA